MSAFCSAHSDVFMHDVSPSHKAYLLFRESLTNLPNRSFSESQTSIQRKEVPS